MIKLSRNVLFLEKKLVICWAFETIIQLPVFTKETVKSSIKETPQVYFLGWKTELEYLGTRYQESTEHNFPLNAGGNPNIHNQKQKQGVQVLPGNIHGQKKTPGDTISAFLSDPRNGLFYHPFMVWVSPHFRGSEECQTDIFLPLLTTVTQSLSIVLRELKAMDWTRLCYMVHYYISSYIYHIYIYLKTKTKKLQVFRVRLDWYSWFGTKPSAQ